MIWRLIVGLMWIWCGVGCGPMPPHPSSESDIFNDSQDTTQDSQYTIQNTTQDTTPPRIILDQERGITVTPNTPKFNVTGQAIDDESSVKSVTVNGKQVALNINGHFSANISLKPGKNLIHIKATDSYDNSASETLNIAHNLPPVVTPPNTTTIQSSYNTGKYYALVIGINRYQHLPNLGTAVNDARAVAAVLQNQYGFRVTTLLEQQATRDNIVHHLNKLREQIDNTDHLLIYYAGHGYFDNQAEKAYWQPVDAEKYEDTHWIIADRITSSIKGNAAKNVLVVSDSCYSGTLTRSNVSQLKTSTANRHSYLQKLLKTPSRLLIASGGNEPVSDTGGKSHSIFALHFLNGLRNMNDSAFTAEELFEKYIKEPVQIGSKQTPEFQVIRQSGHKGGDFVFYKQ